MVPAPRDEEALLSRDERLLEYASRRSRMDGRACTGSGSSQQALPLVLRVVLPVAALALAAAALGRAGPLFQVGGGGGGSASPTAGIVTLEESEGAGSVMTLKEAILVLDGKKVDTIPHMSIYNDQFPWHRNDAKESEVEPKLRSNMYTGREGMWCAGITLAGFSVDAPGGRWGKYMGPYWNDITYFHHMGANCFRLAVLWERLQSKIGTEELDPVPGLEETISFITDKLGGHVIIDPHNGELGLQHGGMNAMQSDFAKLWKAIAKKYGGNSQVTFGLYNQPFNGYAMGSERYFDPASLDENGDMVESWRQWAQAAIDAIREAGAKNLILVPGLRRSTCAEWDGAGFWGESLDGKKHAGNTRLAALEDPEQHLAYDVHQHMDSSFLGTEPGCSGHEKSIACKDKPNCHGADRGLEQTIAWARKYQKKLMMTELSSIPGSQDDSCKERLHFYLQKMNESGVFLGYSAWQFGCATCPGDLTPQGQATLAWYRWHDFGRPCSADMEDCRSSRCCSNPESKCYQKNPGWAACKVGCVPGIDEREAKKYQANWTCSEFTYSPPVCSTATEDCSSTKCCNDPSKQCYKKDEGWAVCRTDCTPGQVWEKDDPAHRTPWNCTVLREETTEIQLK